MRRASAQKTIRCLSLSAPAVLGAVFSLGASAAEPIDGQVDWAKLPANTWVSVKPAFFKPSRFFFDRLFADNQSYWVRSVGLRRRS